MVKSPFAYVRAQLPEKDRRDAALINYRVRQYLDAYNRDEIPLSGVSTKEIEQKLYERRPKTVIMIIDACRTLARGGDTDEDANARSGSRIFTKQAPPRNFLILYSASFGEQAVESLSPIDPGRNSLFTEVLRNELMRPGQSLKELAERVKLMVRATAQNYGEQQEPEYSGEGPTLSETYLIDPIGRERFQMSQEKCTGGVQDWVEIKDRRRHELFERHVRRFDGCDTAGYARRRLAELALSSDDSDEFRDKCLEANDHWQQIRNTRQTEQLKDHLQRFEGCTTGELARRWLTARPDGARPRMIDDCDLLAASDLDRDRPPEVPGVAFEKIAAEDAIAACLQSWKANEFTPRFLFNLGRAYHKRGSDTDLDLEERRSALRSARQSYEDAARRSYVIAISHLAVLLEEWDGKESFQRAAIDLLKRAAEQRQPHAMYILGLHYRHGNGVERDPQRALELFLSAAENGVVAGQGRSWRRFDQPAPDLESSRRR